MESGNGWKSHNHSCLKFEDDDFTSPQPITKNTTPIRATATPVTCVWLRRSPKTARAIRAVGMGESAPATETIEIIPSSTANPKAIKPNLWCTPTIITLANVILL